MNNDIDNFKKRLIYRSQYRGNKEMDKLIGSFVKTHIDKMNKKELIDLESFLNIDDDTLYKFYNNKLIDVNYKKTKVLVLFQNYKYSE